ncbi:MAG: hypothetical protein E7082_08420 [Bacteroidales bacterium]|nr:hypothetical protein [Bacteroidales bacterium]
MTLKSKALVAAVALVSSIAVNAQTVTYKLRGADKADADAVACLEQALPIAKNGSVEIIIGEAGDKAVKQYANLIPTTAEGFYLLTSPSKVVIAGRDGAGTFYGVQQFLQMADKQAVTESSEAPAIALRGVIEGFYGNPWSFENRMSQLKFYGENKMNVYVYGPKDDPYHHSRWYEPYPTDKAAELAELVKYAAKNKVKFTWAMHPSNSIETDEDRAKALKKFQLMYDLGVRSFAIFFDDISAKSVDTQVDYLNFLDREFVKKHSDVESLVVCPTIYNRAWNSGNYLDTMGKGLNPDIKIMWTGNSVCDMIDEADCDWFSEQTGRLPFIWLNYPVNDYGLHNQLLGPVVGNDPKLAKKVSAFCSNPMQYAEASKVALYSLADFAWDPDNFDAQAVWERSLASLMPDHVDAFRTFCLNNVDVGVSVHGLRFYGETPDFKSLNESLPTLYSNDPADIFKTMGAITSYERYFQSRVDAAQELLDAADSGNLLLTEIREWISALAIQGYQGLDLCKMAEALTNGNTQQFIDAYRSYTDWTEKAFNNVSRDFPGSIQSVRVQTGTLYVAPWIKNTAAELADAFKKSGVEYPEDLFPKQLLENGSYYIKYNGLILGNPNAGGRGGKPVFQAEIDDINPNRQEWVLKLDAVTGRYEIRNSKDDRYINELCNFGVNPYSADWNTYIITKNDEGKFAIQNAGSGGDAYWGVNGDVIAPGAPANARYVFEFIPVTK